MAQEINQERLGIGLSGGGLRASFFHIGVLAQMAELDLLRHVEVISTVSGGSIIGAFYYLHVKKLLESKADEDITAQDYIEIVHRIEGDFFKATEGNIRMETFADFKANFRMRFLNYSRSDRIAEIYNKWLYQGVLSGMKDPIEMRELKIFPKNGPGDFHPNQHNGGRKAKVPILDLNATSLNTGRYWQFTAQNMGEPPSLDKNAFVDQKPFRLRRADSYSNVIPEQQDFPVGHAVAASACVPGIFDPMAVSKLYKDLEANEEIRVQLVDGGVHDNQGIETLLRNDCTCFVISDASGQMETENNPGTGAVPVLLRVTNILQDRVRTEGILHLMDSRGKHNVAYMNLRAGLKIREIHWIDQDGQQQPDKVIPPTSAQDFGVNPVVQESLSKMRTDLDAFTEVEAYSLMLDGYNMSKDSLEKFRAGTDCKHIASSAGERVAPQTPWKFQGIAPWINNPNDDYLRQLKIAQATFGKALMCFPWLWGALLAFVALLLYLLGPMLWTVMTTSIPVYALIIIVIIAAMSILAPKMTHMFGFLNILRPKVEIIKAFARASLLFVGTAFIIFYQKVINPMYVKQGRLSRLKKPQENNK